MKRVLALAMAFTAPFATAVQGAAAEPRVVVVDGGTVPGTSKHLKLVGHNPLLNRGMNAAPAVLDDSGFLYVGSRTDGAPDHPNAGILVVDASDPSNPTIVNEIGPPFAANPSETTRELRIWQEQKILIVLTFTCSAVIHHCEGSVTPNFRFFDLSDPANPEFMMNFVPTQAGGTTRTPHEFFLWVDPSDPDRAYIWATTPTGSRNPAQANLVIWDASGVASGTSPRLLAQGNWNQLYEAGSFDGRLANHSMDISADGRTTTLAYQRGHTLVLDTAEVVDSPPPAGTVLDLNDNLLTNPADRPKWGTRGQRLHRRVRRVAFGRAGART